MKKSIFIKCYLEKNLGDDLFFKIVTERYSDIFYTYSCQKYDYKLFSDNLKISYINSFVYRLVNKIGSVLKIGNIFDIYFARKSDLVAIVGGSIFIEGNDCGSLERLYYKRLKKPYYILGANIGPYHTKAYLKNINKILNLSVDTCLRDKTSYDLLENKENVRVEPDIVFSLNCSNYKNYNSKKAIISLINLEKKQNQICMLNFEDYYNKIIEISKKLIDMGYDLCFMSFCDAEGDKEAIEKVTTNLSEYKNNYSIYLYDGNLNEALKVFADSSVVIGSRFHANILGLIMDKTIIPIIYNDKTENMLKDIGFAGVKINLKNINDFDVNDLNETTLSHKTDISREVANSQRQFEELDKVLSLKNGEK